MYSIAIIYIITNAQKPIRLVKQDINAKQFIFVLLIFTVLFSPLVKKIHYFLYFPPPLIYWDFDSLVLLDEEWYKALAFYFCNAFAAVHQSCCCSGYWLLGFREFWIPFYIFTAILFWALFSVSHPLSSTGSRLNHSFIVRFFLYHLLHPVCQLVSFVFCFYLFLSAHFWTISLNSPTVWWIAWVISIWLHCTGHILSHPIEVCPPSN